MVNQCSCKLQMNAFSPLLKCRIYVDVGKVTFVTGKCHDYLIPLRLVAFCGDVVVCTAYKS